MLIQEHSRAGSSQTDTGCSLAVLPGIQKLWLQKPVLKLIGLMTMVSS